ncbi:hypothetical protein GCM10025868_14420 [Angustibacter aerolatus]|uniref:Nitrate/nitrite sensing protein domain-containing protein n=1 Tax=Angustibacter aerolatus TaxID=1162965 RepID=A0ABQ6JH13_9ACTN|nr:DUF4012 domain-containing protein [Angustibacter aerolatus]GMA86192.1 hypothetical protein GCM10025868_14420 [Angustibacter aerolatus]
MQATQLDLADDEDLDTRRRPAARVAVRVVLLLLLLLVVVLAVEAVVAGLSLRSARDDGDRVQAALSAGDVGAAGDGVVSLSRHLGRADTALSGPHWVLPEALPVVGDDLKAVRRTVSALHDTVDGTVDPLLGVVGTLQDTARREDGSIDTDRFAVLSADVARAAPPARRSAAAVDEINLQGVAEPLRQPLGRARDAVDLVNDAVETSRNGLVVATALLGADHRTSMLVGVQNLSEARGSGGLVGALALTSADKGHLEPTTTDVNDSLVRFNTPSDEPAPRPGEACTARTCATCAT